MRNKVFSLLAVFFLFHAVCPATHAQRKQKQKKEKAASSEEEGGQSREEAPPGTHMVVIVSPEEYWKNVAAFAYKTLKPIIGGDVVFAMQFPDDAEHPTPEEFRAVNSKIYRKGVTLFNEQEYPSAIKQLIRAAAGFEALINKYGLSYPLRRRIVLSYMYLGAAQLMDAQTDEATLSFRIANTWFTNYPLPKSAFEEETPRSFFTRSIERSARGSGTIIVSSAVMGHLYLNGVWVGVGPKTISKVRPGTHIVTWARLGYKPVSVKVVVPENDKGVADIKPEVRADKAGTDEFLEGLETHLRTKPNVPPALADLAIKYRVDNIIVFRATANDTEISWFNSKSGGWQKRVRRQNPVPGTLNPQVGELLFESSPVLDLVAVAATQGKCFSNSDCPGGNCLGGACVSASPFYKQWWFWTAVGVGAAALGTGTYFLIQMQNRPILEISTP